MGILTKKFKKILKMGIDNFKIVYYNSNVGNIGVPEMEGFMIALNSLQVIFEKYLNSDSTNLLEFITSNNFATITASGEIVFLNTLPIERFDESKIDYKNIDYIKLGECLSFLDEVKGQLTAADLSLAKRWVANRIEVAFTEGKQLGSRKNVEKLIKDFEVYKNKTVDMRKKHPTVNKAQKVGKSVLGGGAAAGIAGGIVAAALTNGAAISSIPGLTANAAINFGVGASWGVVAAAVLGVSYYTIKHIVTTTVNKAKFKGKKSIELIENADKENIYEMEDVPSIEFLKLFAEKAADIIDFKPSKFNIPGKIVKYFKIKANRNRLHTIENHFKKDIVAEMERISKLLESDSYNKDLINKLARLQSYAAVINSVLDDVAMEDYRDLLSGDSKTRHSTYMDIILGADKKRNTINGKGRIHNASKFDKLATEEEKDAKQESSLSYNGKKPKELKRASSLYGASLIARALSLENGEKSLIQARLDQNAEVRQNKLNEKKSRKDAREEAKKQRQATRDTKLEEKINGKIKTLDDEIAALNEKLNKENEEIKKRAIGTTEYTESVLYIQKLTDEINKKEAEKTKWEQSKPSYIAQHSQEAVEEPVVDEPEKENFEEELEEFKSIIKNWNLAKLTAAAHLYEQTSRSRHLTKLQEEKWNLVGEEINNKNRQTQLMNAELEDFKIWIKSQAEGALIGLAKILKETHTEINERKSNLIGEELNRRLREEQLKRDDSIISRRTEDKPVVPPVDATPADDDFSAPVDAPVDATPADDDFFAPYDDEEDEEKVVDEVKKPAVDETAAKIKELQKQKNAVNTAKKNAANAARAAQYEVERHTAEYERLKTTASNRVLQSIEKKLAKAQNIMEENNQLHWDLSIQSENLEHEIEDLKKSQRKSDLD